MRLKNGVFTAIYALCLFSCAEGTVSDAPSAAPIVPEEEPSGGSVSINADAWAPPPGSVLGAGVYPLNIKGGTAIEISNLQNDTVFLLQLNEGDGAVSSPQNGPASSWHIDGSAAAPSASRGFSVQAADDMPSERVIRLEHADALLFKGPPPLKRQEDGRMRSSAAAPSSSSYEEHFSTKKFWVQRKKDRIWYEISATLRAKNEHCFVWVDNERYNPLDLLPLNNDNKINTTQARTLADKFSLIYEKETALFGFEYGGGPGGDGGVDGLSEVQILVYDIDEDFSPNQNSGVIGFYWSKDENGQAQLDEMFEKDAYKTNLAEIFYIDSYFADRYESIAHSTLIHEFQHMIHFNRKTVALGLSSNVWYNEMLSMLAEDVLCEYIHIPHTSSSHPINGRIPLFLGSYTLSGPADWVTTSSSTISYSSAYAFGAYLARNFGGARLVKEMLDNACVSEKSVTEAVNERTGGNWTFKSLQEKYMEALLFNSSGGVNASFNRKSTETVNGTAYTFEAFDIYAINRFADSSHAAGKGPYVFKPDETWSLRPGTAAVISAESWQQVTGSMTIRLNKPPADVKTYIVLKRSGAAN